MYPKLVKPALPAGAKPRIYLVRIHTAGFADAFFGDYLGGAPDALLPQSGVEESAPLDDVYSGAAVAPSTENHVYDEAAVRHAYITAGDTIALIVQSRKGTADAVPFHQTVVLQNQLLG